MGRGRRWQDRTRSALDPIRARGEHTRSRGRAITLRCRSAFIGNVGLLEQLVRYGADVNTPMDRNPQLTSLHFTVFGREPEVVSLLLENGVSPALRDSAGITPREWEKPKPKIVAVFAAQARP